MKSSLFLSLLFVYACNTPMKLVTSESSKKQDADGPSQNAQEETVAGKDGLPGKDGKDGADGKNGKDGTTVFVTQSYFCKGVLGTSNRLAAFFMTEMNTGEVTAVMSIKPNALPVMELQKNFTAKESKQLLTGIRFGELPSSHWTLKFNKALAEVSFTIHSDTAEDGTTYVLSGDDCRSITYTP